MGSEPTKQRLDELKKRAFAEEAPCVIAGVVTYNPDINRLADNLEAIIPQLSKVFVLDNCSRNLVQIANTLATLDGDVSLICEDENNGLAVAYNKLASIALSANARYLLILDQDSIASADLIQVELSFMGNDVAIVAPQVIDVNYPENAYAITDFGEVDRVISSGSLISLNALMAAGGYDERLFVDWVDYDFCINLKMHGYKIIRTSNTCIWHELGKRELAGMVPRRQRKNGRLELRAVYRTNHSLTRKFDKARSRAIVIRKYKHKSIGKQEKVSFLKDLVKDLLLERRKIKLLAATCRGYNAGSELYKRLPQPINGCLQVQLPDSLDEDL